ncbi:MAG TPA: translational GTPase TypA, partial [Polyangia bacterium]
MSTAVPFPDEPESATSRAVRSDVRNIAIIAHVDHGKTTLVDGFLRQAGTFRPGEVIADCAMDSNDLERERGITILSKFTAITWKGTRINIVDTPGHADFGGEVERVLKMVDSVCLLVDAYEGPMPQTRFVTRKALALGLRPILVVNKVDRPGCDPDGTVDATFDLFCALGATDAQLDFPIVYASGREGWAVRDLKDEHKDLGPLLDMVIDKVPPPKADVDAPLAMHVTTLDYDDYLGYVAIGRIQSGRLKQGERALCVHRDGSREEFRVAKLLGFQSLKRFELAEVAAGDICAVTGMQDLTVGETITDIARPIVLPLLEIEEPTVHMQFMSNNGPFAGTEGKFVTSRNIRDRLFKEVKSNVALRVRETASPDTFEVLGRGELHLTVLIETMRREGYELMVSQPEVIYKNGENGEKTEPYEEVVIDLDEAYSGAVIEELGRRGGRMQEMGPSGTGRMRLEYLAPARGLIGYRSQFLTDTRGTGILYHNFKHYGPYAGAFKARTNGVLVSQDAGETNAYGLFYLQERGQLFLDPGVKVYGGQIIGLHSRDNDLIVNPSKAKKLTNIRTTAADEKLTLSPPRLFTLESALEFINNDELVEVTPKAIRLRKRSLDHNERK